jgi:hypothetical protein
MIDMEELKRQLRRELLGDLKPILESQGIQFPNIAGIMSEEERRSSLASIAAAPMNTEPTDQVPESGRPQEPTQHSLESDTIDNLAHPTICDLVVVVEGNYRMEVGKGLVYPHLTLLDDVPIDSASYVVVKVDMVHEKAKNLKLEVPPDDTTLSLRDTVTRRVQWRRTAIDVDPATTSAPTNPSQSQTAPALILLEAQPESPFRDQPCPSPPRT